MNSNRSWWRAQIIGALVNEVPRRNWISYLSRLGVDKEAQKAYIRRANETRQQQEG